MIIQLPPLAYRDLCTLQRQQPALVQTFQPHPVKPPVYVPKFVREMELWFRGQETIEQGVRMLRTALEPYISRFLEDPMTSGAMLNPDGWF